MGGWIIKILLKTKGKNRNRNSIHKGGWVIGFRPLREIVPTFFGLAIIFSLKPNAQVQNPPRPLASPGARVVVRALVRPGRRLFQRAAVDRVGRVVRPAIAGGANAARKPTTAATATAAAAKPITAAASAGVKPVAAGAKPTVSVVALVSSSGHLFERAVDCVAGWRGTLPLLELVHGVLVPHAAVRTAAAASRLGQMYQRSVVWRSPDVNLSCLYVLHLRLEYPGLWHPLSYLPL